MSIDFEHFSPGASLAGGALIGLSAAWMLLVHGRIAGISGQLGEVVRRVVARRVVGAGSQWWISAVFLAGLASSPLLFSVLGHPAPIHVYAATPTLIVAGLLVGLGTRYAGGCTSGHGVCGLSNRSARSLVATLTFMLVAIVTVGVQRWLF